MALPLFKDLTKSVKDLFSKDFETTSSSLEVKSEAPSGVMVTTTTKCECPKADAGSCGAAKSCCDANLTGKVNLKWARPVGFSVDKLEFSGCKNVELETSLTGLAPGVKLEFKKACGKHTTIGAVYKHQLATAAADVDIEHNKTNASVVGGSNGVLVGAALEVSHAGGKFDLSDYSVALACNRPAGLFAGVSANRKFNLFNSAFQYEVNPALTVAALADYVPNDATFTLKEGDKKPKTKVQLAATYACNPNTDVKVKVDNEGVVHASVKQRLPNKLTVVGAVTIKTSEIKSLNYGFGVAATLG